MQLKETQEALVAAAQEGVTIGNAILSLFPGDNTKRSSNVNPILTKIGFTVLILPC